MSMNMENYEKLKKCNRRLGSLKVKRERLLEAIDEDILEVIEPKIRRLSKKISNVYLLTMPYTDISLRHDLIVEFEPYKNISLWHQMIDHYQAKIRAILKQELPRKIYDNIKVTVIEKGAE